MDQPTPGGHGCQGPGVRGGQLRPVALRSRFVAQTCCAGNLGRSKHEQLNFITFTNVIVGERTHRLRELRLMTSYINSDMRKLDSDYGRL